MTSGMRGTAVVFLCVALTGCRFFGKAQPDPIPVPDPPHPVEAKVPPPKLDPPGPPPKIETKAPEVPSAVAGIPNPPAPKRKRPQTKKPVGVATGTAQSPPQVLTLPPPKDPAVVGTGETATPAVPVAVVPKLGEIFSDDQKFQALKTCDESLARAREAVAQLHGMTLSQEQKQSMTRVKVFISQAEQARQRDPQTAKQLAERAELLSRDLLRTAR